MISTSEYIQQFSAPVPKISSIEKMAQCIHNYLCFMLVLKKPVICFAYNSSFALLAPFARRNSASSS